MTTLRLGVHRLSPAETGLIRALVRLIGSGDLADFRWEFADVPPYDALITDASSDKPGLAAVHHSHKPVLYLDTIDSAIDDLDFMPRPIRADLLEVWLLRTQRLLSDPPSSTDNDSTLNLDPSIRYKLRRWPPNQLLHRDPHRIRMATLLSRRPLRAAELAKAGQRPVEECRRFLSLLQQMDLLEICNSDTTATTATATATTTPQTPTPAPAQAQPPSPRPGPGLGLIRSIRLRLGL